MIIFLDISNTALNTTFKTFHWKWKLDNYKGVSLGQKENTKWMNLAEHESDNLSQHEGSQQDFSFIIKYKRKSLEVVK